MENISVYENDKRQLVFADNLCKGCNVCASVCPKQLLKLDDHRVNQAGYNPMTCIDIDTCIACGMCGIMCPDSVITVRRVA